MAKAKTKSAGNGVKISFGKKKGGVHTKHVNKHSRLEKDYVGQGGRR
jgi:hypothetical protein